MAAITRAGTLVDGLLAFSRAGGYPEPGVSTEVGPVIADVVEALSGQAREQRIDLTVSASAPARAAVVCSKGVLTSLLSNLLRNAIKYMGDAPRRVIDVRALDAGGRWRIEVEDTGPGIAEAQQERIFRPHVQLGQTAGIGLGLATVDRLIRGHAGALGVISSPGRGSVFWFELPKPDATPAEDEARCTTLEQHAAT
jgi:signal transduction histidine kinase